MNLCSVVMILLTKFKGMGILSIISYKIILLMSYFVIYKSTKSLIVWKTIKNIFI